MQRSVFVFVAAAVWQFAGVPCAADDQPVTSANVRWADGGGGGSPDFRRHVVPLFSKLGCNMRSCHGSFQGQNGFRLSLFGFEPELDRAELLEVDELSEGEGPRANLKSPADSLVLHKPTPKDEHEGGQRMSVGSWQYNIFREWIADRGPFDPDKDPKLVRFELQPSELVFTRRDKPKAVKAIAWFDDDTVEDVTALTTFTSNDDGIAAVDDDGTIRVDLTGDTAVIAQYAGGVASTQILVPASASDAPYPPLGGCRPPKPRKI